MNKQILILLFCTVLYKPLFAQTDSIVNIENNNFKNKIGLSLGYNQGYLKDLNYSPLNYSQGSVLGVLDYSHKNPKSIIEAMVIFSQGNLNTKVSENFTSLYIFGKVQLGYLHKLPLPVQEKLSIYLGGQYQTQGYYYQWQSQLEVVGWMATHGIRIKALVNYQLSEKSQLQTSISIPIFQSLVRPPYNGRDEFITDNQNDYFKIGTTGQPSSFNKYLGIDWQTTYSFAVSKRFDLKFRYSMVYQRVFSSNDGFIQLQNQFSIGTNFKF